MPAIGLERAQNVFYVILRIALTTIPVDDLLLEHDFESCLNESKPAKFMMA